MNTVRFNLNHCIVLCLILSRTIPLSDPYQIQYPTKRETPSNAAKSKMTAGTTVAQTNCTGKVARCVQDAVYAMPKQKKHCRNAPYHTIIQLVYTKKESFNTPDASR
jgi:hypothetical protein